IADGSLSSRRLAELAGLADGTQARTLVRRLNERYDAMGHQASAGQTPGLPPGRGQERASSHGGTAVEAGRSPGSKEERAAFRVEEVAGGFQLLTRPGFSPWLRRLGELPASARLSTSALETLAVIAYRQPVVRAEL